MIYVSMSPSFLIMLVFVFIHVAGPAKLGRIIAYALAAVSSDSSASCSELL
jgi:hypothetical protein